MNMFPDDGGQDKSNGSSKNKSKQTQPDIKTTANNSRKKHKRIVDKSVFINTESTHKKDK